MASEKRVALVIGNSAYSNASLLKNPANDARDIANALTRVGFSGVMLDESTGSLSDVEPLVPLFDLNYDRLRRALAAFARVSEEADQAVLYYAGHGIEVGGRNYLIPIDAKLQHARDVGFETASLDDVMGAVEEGNGLRLLILDACRDNPFRSRMISTRALSRGLNLVEPPSNHILVAYSSKHGTVALDGNKDNSPYAIALLNYLEQPGLEIADLFREVQDFVLEATGRRQEPRTYGSLGRRKYYFVPPVARPVDFTPRIVEKDLFNDSRKNKAGQRKSTSKNYKNISPRPSHGPPTIFVSYARDDDLSPPDKPDRKGFVTFLDEAVRYEFTELGPERPQIWRDTRHIRVSDGDQFAPKSEEVLKNASFFLVVLSPNWMASQWCRRELDTFAKYHSADRLRERIVVVGKRHVDPDTRPPLLQGQTGFAFYARNPDPDDAAGDIEFFYHGEPRDERYWQRIKALAAHVVRRRPF